jgi:hypothetical protein
MYYRLPNGWIGVGAVGVSGQEMYRMMRRGWQPLSKYGKFNWDPYYLDHPFEVLIQNGGADEIPFEQLEAMGYLFDPPLIPVCGKKVGRADDRLHRQHDPYTCWNGAQPARFPQLEGRSLPAIDDLLCHFCNNGERYPTIKSRDQHVRVMHNEILQTVAQGKTVADSIVEAFERMQMGTTGRFVCPECNAPEKTIADLRDHLSLHLFDGDSDHSKLHSHGDASEPSNESARKGRRP